MLADTPNTFESWKFAIEVIISVLMPIIIFQLEANRRRLAKGDEKFDTLTETTIAMREVLKSLVTVTNDQSRDIRALGQADADGSLQGAVNLGELKREIERDFVRKQEFQMLREEIRNQHAEILREVRKPEHRR